jgi:SAM-dependent methyltransferase
VLGIDLSPEMIEVARSRSVGCSNITYEVADVLAQPLPAARYDCIASIATLHHLPLTRMLADMSNALRPGGVLLVLDLFEPEDWHDRLLNYAGAPVSLALRLLKRGSLRESEAARQAWALHGQHDTYPTLKAVRQACEAVLPGAMVRRHVLWRYSIIWRKPLQQG